MKTAQFWLLLASVFCVGAEFRNICMAGVLVSGILAFVGLFDPKPKP